MKPLKLLFVCSIFLLSVPSCGVKEMGSQAPAVVHDQLPPGVHGTKNKLLLVHSSQDTFKVNEFGERTTVYYKIVNPTFELLGAEYTYEASYWMPDMPAMPITPIVTEVLSPGNLKITYNIEMAGKWEFTIKVSKDSKLVDTYNYIYEVPQE